MAATANAQQRSYGYGSGPSWSPMSQAPSYRAPVTPPGPGAYRSQSYEAQGAPANPSYQHPYANPQVMETPTLPDVRVVSPSSAGDHEHEHEHEKDWDDDKSVYSTRSSTMSSNYYSSVLNHYHDPRDSNQLSVYSAGSGRGDVLRDSWQTSGTARPDSNVDPFSFRRYETPPVQLPRVVVSSPSEASFRRTSNYEGSGDESSADAGSMPVVPKAVTPPPTVQAQGRAPSAVQGARNFSRPSRPAVPYNGSEDHKREVLQRNLHRHGSGSPQSQSYPSPPPSAPASSKGKESSLGPSKLSDEDLEDVYGGMLGRSDDDHLGSEYVAVPSPPHQPLPNQNNQPRTPSPSRTSPLGIPSLSHSSSLSSTSSAGQSPRTPQGLVPLPANPPAMRTSTPESVYSNYSFYQLEPTTPSPSASTTKFPSQQSLSPLKKGGKSPTPNSPTLPGSPQSAEDYLALGIAHHEADRLAESARCFEQSATLNGGTAVGMLMWGLSLRHGWGVAKDEPRAFKWLKRAAEHAVVDLQEGKGGGRDAVKNELVLAVYEVGQCFFRGWGVPRDKVMGVSYFQTAAQLGDPDAQQDLAFCLANGKGCKKDRKAAAKWYRAAAAQGASTVGLAWIYKPKYAE